MGSSARTSPLPVLALALTAVLLASVPVALAAEELTRPEYVERVEPICKTNSDANSRILKGVKDQVKSDQLVPAGKRFIRASAALGTAVAKIAAVPQPSEDAAKLTKWIGYLKHEKTFLQQIGAALKAKDKFHAQKLAVELNKNNNRANNTVISFGFEECRIDSSRFI
ncbi:MAG TPA: hypothetical protein VLK56_10130 [Solirubrobacterales bacterium]|nr:hypothetical protein [Solirubrobacterales bacterium]